MFRYDFIGGLLRRCFRPCLSLFSALHGVICGDEEYAILWTFALKYFIICIRLALRETSTLLA
jgi:hypothetical protein